LVCLNEVGELTFGLSREAEPFIRAMAQDGDIIEVSAAGHRLMFELGSRIAKQGGVALFIDYGHCVTSIGDTLQALRAHRMVDPLSEPGKADITAHVDFAAMARSARAAGAAVYGPMDQGDFLTAIGIEERAAALIGRAAGNQAADIEAARQRLTGKGPEEMGALFKVLVVANRALPAPPGFHTVANGAR